MERMWRRNDFQQLVAACSGYRAGFLNHSVKYFFIYSFVTPTLTKSSSKNSLVVVRRMLRKVNHFHQLGFVALDCAIRSMISLGKVPTSIISGRLAKYSFTPERFYNLSIKSSTDQYVFRIS